MTALSVRLRLNYSLRIDYLGKAVTPLDVETIVYAMWFLQAKPKEADKSLFN